MRTLLTIFLVAALTFPAHAGTKVLGYEIGVSKLDEVRAKLEKQTKVTDAGTNKYAGGKVLRTDGTGYGMKGLKKAEFFFDEKRKLSCVFLYIALEYYSDLYNDLSKKYEKVADLTYSDPDYRPARFVTNDLVIDLFSHRTKGSVFLRYIRNDAFRNYFKPKIFKKSRNSRYTYHFTAVQFVD